MKEDSEARLLEKQMDFHVRSGFTRPAERNLSESKTWGFVRRPADGRVLRESDEGVQKRSA